MLSRPEFVRVSPLRTAQKMGLDGGTKITRSDVLRRQSARWAQQDTSRSTRGGSVSQVYQEQRLDEQIRRTILWTTCALSGLPLTAPIMADALGQLFNRQAVLEHLLAAKAAAAAAAAAAPASAPAAAAVGTLSPGTTIATTGSLASGCKSSALGHSTHSDSSRSLVTYAPPAGVSMQAGKDIQDACLRYENQQRAAAAAAADADGNRDAPSSFSHIRSLRDVFNVILTNNPDLGTSGSQALEAGDAAGHQVPSRHPPSSLGDLPSPWMCPVTLHPCGSKQPCVALRSCGHVMSQKALLAVTAEAHKPKKRAAALDSRPPCAGDPLRSHSSKVEDVADPQDGMCCCPVCDAPFHPDRDQVLINGSQQHMDAMRLQLQEAAAAKAQEKSRKKRKIRADAGQQQQQTVPQTQQLLLC